MAHIFIIHFSVDGQLGLVPFPCDCEEPSSQCVCASVSVADRESSGFMARSGVAESYCSSVFRIPEEPLY